MVINCISVDQLLKYKLQESLLELANKKPIFELTCQQMLLKCGIESERPLKLKSLSTGSAEQSYKIVCCTSARIKSQSICAELLKYAIDKDQHQLEILMLDVLYYSFNMQNILDNSKHASISEKLVEQVYRLWQKTK